MNVLTQFGVIADKRAGLAELDLAPQTIWKHIRNRTFKAAQFGSRYATGEVI